MVVEAKHVLALSMGMTAAVGIAALATIVLNKRQSKDEDEEEEEDKDDVDTSRMTRLEVKVPSDISAQLIGRGGENVKHIEGVTNTRIRFKDEKLSSCEDYRVLLIEGSSQSTQLAEILVRQSMSEHAAKASLQTSEHFYVPSSVVGRLIGRGGESVRLLQSSSKCKISVERSEEEDGKRKVTLQGTYEQIEMAKSLINDFLAREGKRGEQGGERREQRRERVEYESHLFLTCDTDQDLELRRHQTSEVSHYHYDVLDPGHSLVMVSSVCDPSHFYVQKSGPQSVALDKLSEAMTDYYDNEANVVLCAISREEIRVDDVVATRFEGDDKWYRAKVVEVTFDDYDSSKVEVELDFVDYGDCVRRNLDQVCRLHSDFSKLSFQAIDCRLFDLDLNNSFSEQACDEFESLTRCAQWKEIEAKVIEGPTERTRHPTVPTQAHVVLLVHLEDNQVLNVADELVRLGHASQSNK